ncbi:hypothetical protein Mmc1_1814 [Magnetococcus marinus MC-1]|uniref:Uncharacterized protein n=1 Tax=Magnetococcus marinus (strain ATCC BAA-1437 / JCM 17883 / MC-1) TaxID=156889 RepID=A0L8M9_MAGMM|nr:hypothetical protein [Magnetococcus marinus]ABK44322.1 hypothetical protein Mmc1_1814 [Magnetococcus marinus MC-1]
MLEELQKQIDEERRLKLEKAQQEQMLRVRLAVYMLAGFGIISLFGAGMYMGGAFDMEISSNGKMMASPAEKRMLTQAYLDESRQNQLQGMLTLHDPWPRVRIDR